MSSSPLESVHPRTAADPVDALRDAEARLFRVHGLAVRERWLSLARPKIRARVLESGEGPPVLHVHGGGTFGAVSVPLAAALPGRRHLLLDRPGFGLSERADVYPDFRARSIELLVSTLDALELDSVDIVANSIGAGMAMWLALAHPSRVRSLAFVGGAAMLPGPELPFVLRLLAMPVIGPLLLALERPSPAQVRAFLRRFGHDPDAVEPALQAVVLAAERVPTHAVAWRELLQATISWKGQRPGLVLTQEELRAIACPVAFAWGAKDPMVDARDGRAAAEQMRDARFEVVGTGHAPWLDDAAGVARAIEPVLAPRGERADSSLRARGARSGG